MVRAFGCRARAGLCRTAVLFAATQRLAHPLAGAVHAPNPPAVARKFWLGRLCPTRTTRRKALLDIVGMGRRGGAPGFRRRATACRGYESAGSLYGSDRVHRLDRA